jgi:hypothetical protein
VASGLSFEEEEFCGINYLETFAQRQHSIIGTHVAALDAKHEPWTLIRAYRSSTQKLQCTFYVFVGPPLPAGPQA